MQVLESLPPWQPSRRLKLCLVRKGKKPLHALSSFQDTVTDAGGSWRACRHGSA